MQLDALSGLYFPDAEEHFLSRNKKGRPVWRNYQVDRILAALPYVSDFRCALDVGAHVGLLALALADHFPTVACVEPHPDNLACLRENLRPRGHQFRIYPYAVGAALGRVGVESGPTPNSGDRQTVPGGFDVPLQTVDSLMLAPVGLVKIDVQGYEAEVLRGAAGTFHRDRPVLIVEVEPPGKLRRTYGDLDEVPTILRGWGMERARRLGTDQIWIFPREGGGS